MMRTSYSILHPSFRYVPAVATSVAETWRRFGWRPTTDEERKRRRHTRATLVVEEIAAARAIGYALPRAQGEPRALTAAA
jgi:hypothetical protein